MTQKAAEPSGRPQHCPVHAVSGWRPSRGNHYALSPFLMEEQGCWISTPKSHKTNFLEPWRSNNNKTLVSVDHGKSQTLSICFLIYDCEQCQLRTPSALKFHDKNRVKWSHYAHRHTCATDVCAPDPWASVSTILQATRCDRQSDS